MFSSAARAQRPPLLRLSGFYDYPLFLPSPSGAGTDTRYKIQVQTRMRDSVVSWYYPFTVVYPLSKPQS